MASFPFSRDRKPKGERGETLPESNPDTPPDSTDPTGVCPRCSERSSFEVGPSHPVSFDGGISVLSAAAGGASIPKELDQATILLCRNCKQGVVVVEEEWIGDHPAREGLKGGGFVTWRGIHWWPAPGAADLNESIPLALRDAFVEGIRAHGAKAPHAAAVMFRRTIEGMVRQMGNQEAVKQLDNGDLPGALLHMNKAGILDKTLYEWALEIRALGNTGGHFDPFENVSIAQSQELVNAVRALLRYVYEEPARMRRLRDSRWTKQMDDMAQAEVAEASHNEAATLVRMEFGTALAAALRAGGKALWIGGSMIGPDRAEGDSPFEFGSDATVGLATVLQIGGELVGGGIALHGEGNRYGAAALARQLVEVEYLAWAFGEDDEEAERWMRSGPQERREMWQPRHLRERADGRFRGVDYGLHCGQGGHPSPEGINLLPEHYSPEASAELWFADMVIHGHSVWRYALAAAEKLEYAETLESLEEARELAAVEERWRETDPFLGSNAASEKTAQPTGGNPPRLAPRAPPRDEDSSNA